MKTLLRHLLNALKNRGASLLKLAKQGLDTLRSLWQLARAFLGSKVAPAASSAKSTLDSWRKRAEAAQREEKPVEEAKPPTEEPLAKEKTVPVAARAAQSAPKTEQTADAPELRQVLGRVLAVHRERSTGLSPNSA